MNISKISNSHVSLSYGGLWDATKVVSPDVVAHSDGRYTMYYVGTSCPPHERKGYRLLRGDSEDGINFKKYEEPILTMASGNDKHYSPCVVAWKGVELLFYGLGTKSVYMICMARSRDQGTFRADNGPVINVNAKHLAAVHSPKVVVGQDNSLVCYYTGSHSKEKEYSKQFPDFDFASGFKLFRSVSVDSHVFFEPEMVTIHNCSFKNIYGHNVLVDPSGVTYLAFAGFDGSVNRLYLTRSHDGLNFEAPELLFEPDHSKQELGLYSSSLLKVDSNQFRIYYGCRYFDNRWKILTRTFYVN